MKITRRKLGVIILVVVLMLMVVHMIVLKVWRDCDGKCYEISQTVEFEVGGYPRMAQVGDLLLVAYSNGSFVLDGINLSTNEQIGPQVIINNGTNPERSTLLYSADLEMLICVFNHDMAASCGIAWVPKNQLMDPSAWSIQYSIVGPVEKEFFHIGLWEPYLAPYNSTTFLLYMSNQTIYDPENPIDVENYSFTLEGYEVVQKIEIYWTKWNGTGFELSYCGAASQTLTGGPVHYKDGMASSVLVSENSTHKEYIMTFEAFPPPAKIARITMVNLVISSSGVQTLWRREITHEIEGAPFLATQNGTLIVSFRHHAIIGPENIGFIGMQKNQNTYSRPIYLNNDIFGWPSVLVDEENRLWVAGGNKINGKVTIQEINLDFIWEDPALPQSFILFHQSFVLFILFLYGILLFEQPILRPNQFFKKLTVQKVIPFSFLPIACFTLLIGFGFASFIYFEYFDIIFPIISGLILLLWIYYSCVSYLLGRVLKQKANFLKTLEFTQYFFVPLIVFFFALFGVLSIFGPESMLNYIARLLVEPLFLIVAVILAGIVLIWLIIVALLGISKNFQCSLWKAGLVYLIPTVLLDLGIYWFIDNYLTVIFPLLA